MTAPFHAGEVQIQELTGERDAAIMNGRLIGGTIPVAARQFVASQSYCAIGWTGANGDVWASFVVGDAGFAESDETGAVLSLEISDATGVTNETPPFHEMREGDNLGVLFIELSTRRRLRVNGVLTSASGNQVIIAVAEAFPNCPKYIQRREVAPNDTSSAPKSVEAGDGLTEESVGWVKSADTFFVASAFPGGAVDVSHRGGNPGFVKQLGDHFRIPDYPGNSMFGTLGNFALNPRAGLAFPDFENNRQLLLTGDVTLDLNAVDDTSATLGTGRWWDFKPRGWIIAPLNRPLNWTFVDQSPYNP